MKAFMRKMMNLLNIFEIHNKIVVKQLIKNISLSLLKCRALLQMLIGKRGYNQRTITTITSQWQTILKLLHQPLLPQSWIPRDTLWERVLHQLLLLYPTHLNITNQNMQQRRNNQKAFKKLQIHTFRHKILIEVEDQLY